MISFILEVKNIHLKTHSQLQNKFGGKFVVERDNRVIASAPTMKALFTRLKKEHISYTNTKDIIVGRIPPKGTTCVY